MERSGAARAAESMQSVGAAASRRGRAAHSRRRVASVALAAGLLWMLQAPPPSAAPDQGASAPAATRSVDEQSIARVLARWNPQLSEPEGGRIARAVTRYSAKYDLDPELVTAVILVESEAHPGARSPRGAVGLMQVMPQTLAPLRLAGNPTTVESNVEVGCRVLAENIRRLGEEDGILAYFWGSNIRGDAYLERVRAARAAVRRLLLSS